MPSDIKVPTLPESVSEATVLEWHKKEGDFVHRDETLVDIETDKVVLEVPAPQDGVLRKISHPSGDTVGEGDFLAIIEDATAEQSNAETKPESAKENSDNSTEQNSDRHGPAVRSLLAQNKLSEGEITGSGKDGRITKEDIVKHIDKVSNKKVAAQSEPAPSTPNSVPQPAPLMGLRERSESRKPMSRIRQTIAGRLVKAQQTAAMLTTFNEVDMSTIIALRSRYKKEFEEQHGARLGFMSFFVKAAAEALHKFPMVNAFIDGTDVVQHNYADISIAVSSPRGLLVPVLRDCELKSFARIESETRDFGVRAQNATIKMEELSGGTFTITNGGVFGSLLSTPILNPPQSAILGMHKIQERPMAENGEVVIRPMMYLALSYDHRIVDGKEAVQFLVHIKASLEDPSRMLFDL